MMASSVPAHAGQSAFNADRARARRLSDHTRLWRLGMRVFVFGTAIVLMGSQTLALYGTREIDIARWTALGLLVLMIFLRPRGAIPLRKPGLWDGVFLAFITLAFASTLYSEFPPLTLGRSTSALLFYAAVFWSVWLFADAVGASRVGDYLLKAAAAMFLLGIANALVGTNAWYALRFRGVFGNPNAIGMLSIIFLPAAVGRFIRTKQVSALLVIALIGGSLILSGSRNGVMTSAIALVFLLYRVRAWRAVMMIGAFASLLLLVMPTPAETSNDQDPLARLTTGQKLTTGGGRLEAWQTALPIIRERPILGYGFGTEELIFKGRTFRIHRGEYIHNSYLGATYQLGIVGSALLFLPLIGLLLRRITSREPATVQMATCEAILLGGLIASMFESWIYSAGNAFAFPFWIFVMLLVRGPLAARDAGDVIPRSVGKGGRRARYQRPVAIGHPLRTGGSAIPRFDPPRRIGAG